MKVIWQKLRVWYLIFKNVSSGSKTNSVNKQVAIIACTLPVGVALFRHFVWLEADSVKMALSLPSTSPAAADLRGFTAESLRAGRKPLDRLVQVRS